MFKIIVVYLVATIVSSVAPSNLVSPLAYSSYVGDPYAASLGYSAQYLGNYGVNYNSQRLNNALAYSSYQSAAAPAAYATTPATYATAPATYADPIFYSASASYAAPASYGSPVSYATPVSYAAPASYAASAYAQALYK